MVNTKKTNVALVFPPFGSPHLPSLGLAILSAGLKKRGFSCDKHYWNYSFILTPAERILDLEVRSATRLNDSGQLISLSSTDWTALVHSDEYAAMQKKKAYNARATSK